MWFGIVLINIFLVFAFSNDRIKTESKTAIIGVAIGGFLLISLFSWLMG